MPLATPTRDDNAWPDAGRQAELVRTRESSARERHGYEALLLQVAGRLEAAQPRHHRHPPATTAARI